MLERAKDIIEDVARETDSVILFHSLSGKDSIVLLDLLYPKFKRVLCVYMYVVKDLEHINQYYMWAKRRYPNIEFVQVPHYAYFNYVKYGFMGIARNPKQREYSLSQIADKVRERSGIEWVCCGFKQSDSLNRRLMLRSQRRPFRGRRKSSTPYPPTRTRTSKITSRLTTLKAPKPTEARANHAAAT